jgi:trehalose synthase-fused probable maltokinase
VSLQEPRIDEQALIEWVTAQRWFGSKTRSVAHAEVVEAVELRGTPPTLVLALVETRFQPGTHETYQVLIGERADGEGWSDGVIGAAGGRTLYDALRDPVLARELVQLMRAAATVQAADGKIEFHNIEGLGETGSQVVAARPIGVEQSNTSVVFDEALILKCYRRLEAGINPDLEILQFLTELGFRNVPPLRGWYDVTGRFIDATLGVLQDYVTGARDGWELTLDDLSADPEQALRRLRRLGEVTGELHSALASDPSDPSFCPEQPSVEALGLLTATVDEEIEQIFLDLPDTDALGPIAGRGEEVRERLRMLTHGSIGKVIRHHGDYHLGQTLWNGSDWLVIDFEGEPARTLPERRRKRSPLRDVAGMLRSFAYAASASSILRGVDPPSGWEEDARNEFLDGYREAVVNDLLPTGDEAFTKLLTVFELEKAVYELRYELNHRPDWIPIPVAGIMRLLEAPLTA